MFYRGRHRHRSPLGCLSRVLTFALLIFLVGYPFVEPLTLSTEFTTLEHEDLPADIGQLRIVYVSDIHAGPFFSQGRVESLVRSINAHNPDLVLLGGDYATDSTGAIAFFQNLPPIHARYAVIGVMGNHDRTMPESNLTRLTNAMYESGVTPLCNDALQVRIGNSAVWVAGIDDVSNGHPDLAGVAARVKADDYVIFLGHSPEIIPEAHKAVDMNRSKRGWFDLALFGHTHGGQIALVGDLLGISHVDARYERGWLKENRADILISHGVGTSLLPIRVLRPPQLHVITVKAK